MRNPENVGSGQDRNFSRKSGRVPENVRDHKSVGIPENVRDS